MHRKQSNEGRQKQVSYYQVEKRYKRTQETLITVEASPMDVYISPL